MFNFVQSESDHITVYLDERLRPEFCVDNPEKLSTFLWSMQPNPQDCNLWPAFYGVLHPFKGVTHMRHFNN